jgi:FlaA1/EpsC-like NDP-sugar epimerase
MRARIIQAAIELPRSSKRALVIAIDATLCVLSVWFAFYLRLGEWVSLLNPGFWNIWLAVGLSVVIALPIFITQGFYRAIFRYAGWSALVTVAKALLMYGLIYILVITVITVMGLEGLPRTIGIIQPALLLLLVGASRIFARYWLGGAYQRQLQKATLPKMLIYGAGDAGRQMAVALANSQEMQVVGFLDDDQRLHGRELNGLQIYGVDDLPSLTEAMNVSHVLLALPSIGRVRRNKILNTLAPFKVQVRTLPSMNDLAHGRVSISDIKDLDIDDLLGREAVQPDEVLLNLNTRGKTVVVTGAGGSIGSELCRQILKTNPKKLLLVETSEFALYQIHQELEHIAKDIELLPLLASVCDEARMQEIMHAWKPHTVYHAAAYKHVPLVEHNPAEGVRNNVWGTWVCAEAAVRNGVRNFVLISTDKAVRPTNIMGATKRLAEMVLQALAEVHTVAVDQEASAPRVSTIFSMVRFGNVLGSSGSVVPLFREQIKSGGPITLTHAGITRYFMTIPEAAQLVIQAGAMGQGGDVFVLDMGQPVKIIDLARRMVELSGLTVRDELHPDGDIELTVTGLRPGEKLYEELLIGDHAKPTQHPCIMRAHEQFLNWSRLKEKLNVLGLAMSENEVPVIRDILEQLVSGYRPSGEVVDWVYLALEREALVNDVY